MKNLILLLITIVFSVNLFCQTKDSILLQKNNLTKDVKVEFERPFNFFAAAGASYRFGDQYNLVTSPVDYSLQFEKVYPIMTRFSLGLVWNPIPDKGDGYVENFIRNKTINTTYKAARKFLAIALLVNVFQLGYSENDINTSSPIDVGFGLGYRSSNFLILGTLEFTPMRTPRQYILDQYKGQNRPLILAGATEPVRTISSSDNSIFMDKVYPSIGLKIAYSFNTKKE